VDGPALTLPRQTGRRFIEVALDRVGWRAPLLLTAMIVGVIGRLSYSWNAPLWFDETFSAVIATQPNVAALLDWCLSELTGPAFYMPLWLWAKIAGSSDVALRLPSVLLSIVAPLLILWKGHANRDLRMWWAVFALLWVPMFGVAGEARPYPQMFLLGVVQAILFVQLLDRPTTARASGWIIASAVLILTQYWGVVPCLVQGIAYLGYHRVRAMATWPAALLLLPMFGWAYFHLPAVLQLTVGNDLSSGGLPPSAVLEIPAMLLGVSFSATVILGVVIGSTTIALAQRRAGPISWGPSTMLAVCGAATIALVLVIAFTRPGFLPRYLTPSMPSFLFALALWARWMVARDPRPVIVATAMMMSTAIGLLASIFTGTERDPRHIFNLQQPAAWLAERQPQRLVIFWDGPVASASSSAHLAEVGGFFLRRGGRTVAVSVARAAADQDPNQAVLALSGSDAAILWFANDDLPDSRTPRIARYDPRYECRDFGGGQLTMTACRPRSPGIAQQTNAPVSQPVRPAPLARVR